MKKTVCMLVLLLMVGFSAYGVGLGDALQSSGLLANNTHAHLTTMPSTIHVVQVTASVANGYVCLIETVSASNQDVSLSTGLSGKDFVSKGKVLADVVCATANNTITVSFPYGIACGRNLFYETSNAVAEIYYKE